jgi:hypothetical protein
MAMETNQESSTARLTPFRDEREAGPSFSGGSFLAASIWIDRRRELSRPWSTLDGASSSEMVALTSEASLEVEGDWK